MTLKEKLKFFLDEELIDEAEYQKLVALADDEEVEGEVEEENVNEAEVEPEKEEMEAEQPSQDPHPEIPDGEEEDVEEIVEEAETETIEEEAQESPIEQAGEEDALIKENADLKTKIEEMGKAFDGLVSRLEVVEKTLSGMSIQEEINPEEVGLSGKGKVANGGEAVQDDSKAIKKLLGQRDY